VFLLASVLFATTACSQADESPSSHTPKSLLDALSDEEERGLECELTDDNPSLPYIECEATGLGFYDSKTFAVFNVAGLDFPATQRRYQATHEQQCSREELQYIDGNPYDLNKDRWFIIGRNWNEGIGIFKRSDAEALADVTGGTVFKGSEWCADPRPLMEYVE